VKGDTSDRIESVSAVTGVRIYGKELDKVVAGSAVWVVNYLGDKTESESELKKRVMEDIHLVMSNWARASSGVYVQGNKAGNGGYVTVIASSLGSLEALLDFLKTSDVPIAGVNIGPVTKRDVIRASSAKYSNSGIKTFFLWN
jgi:translation initiation factor 5B